MGGAIVDVTCDESTGTLVAVGPDLDASGHRIVDVSGHALLPGLIEAHAHLDKAFLADRVDNPQGDLMGAIIGLEAIRAGITHADIVSRATRAAVALSRNGVTSIRTHADVTTTGGLTPLLALLETRRRCAPFIDIDVAMLLEWPLSGVGRTPRLSLARDAIAAGAMTVGGCPHLDDEPMTAVEELFALASEHGLPLDFHADENLRPDSVDLELIADHAATVQFPHRINASHCVSLSVMEQSRVHRIAEKAASRSISVTVLPQTNLFLQSRDRGTAQPRAIAPVSILEKAGVNVAAGADNAQDPFNPLGRLDPLETAALLVLAAHQDTSTAVRMVTSNASRMLHGRSHDLVAGDPADLVFIPATNEREAVAMAPAGRIVVKRGVIIDDDMRLAGLG